MPIHSYGVLKCKVIDRRLGSNENPHYQVHAIAIIMNIFASRSMLSRN
jgi:hypothetical protein